MVSNTYCVVFFVYVFVFVYVGSFSGFSILHCPFGILKRVFATGGNNIVEVFESLTTSF